MPRPPSVHRVLLPELGESLEAVAEQGPDGCIGAIAAAICAISGSKKTTSLLLARMGRAAALSYRDVEVVELPPPTQGVAALEAFGIYERMSPVSPIKSRQCSWPRRCLRLVRDGADVRHLLSWTSSTSAAGAKERRREPTGGTVYLCAVDQDRMAVSFIQSIFGHFGSGLVAPGTGIVLNNRAACFSVAGRSNRGRGRTTRLSRGCFATTRPLAVRGHGRVIQAQAHFQLVTAIVDDDCDPQAALDRSCFRIDGSSVHLEAGYWDRTSEIESLGLTSVLSSDPTIFGGGQAVLVRGESLVGGSDSAPGWPRGRDVISIRFPAATTGLHVPRLVGL